MAKKKKKKEDFFVGVLKTGFLMGTGAVAVSALPPNVVSPQVTSGLSQASASFPAVGRLAGAGLVVKQAGRLIKTTSKLSKKKKRKRKNGRHKS